MTRAVLITASRRSLVLVHSNTKNETEADFDIHELFISKTDKKGLIQFCNSVFTRISGFTKAELIGSPHNIIRHPDMPKAIFQFFWETLKQNQPIAAYVKNKSKDGSYYWVLALAIPISEGYFSIRLKPSSHVFDKIKTIYAEMLQLEKIRSVQESRQFLFQSINQMGFEDYPSFMAYALSEEMDSRQNLAQNINSNLTGVLTDAMTSGQSVVPLRSRRSMNVSLKQLQVRVDESIDIINKSQELILKLKTAKGLLKNKVALLENLTSNMDAVATNMSISAHKIGREGSTLAIVAGHLQQTIKSIKDMMPAFSKLTQEVETSSPQIIFGLNASRLKCEMISQFITEVTTSSSDHNVAVKEISNILETLTALFLVSCAQIEKFNNTLVELRFMSREMSDKITKLTLIYSGGRLESSRAQEVTGKFKPFLDDLNKMATELEKPTSEILNHLNEVCDIVVRSLTQCKKTEFLLSEGLTALSYHPTKKLEISLG